jgi:hypothetical protein
LSQNGSITCGSGGRYLFDIQNAVGQPGTDWDFLSATGGIDVQSTPSNPFVIQVRSLSDTGFGPMLSFDNSTPQNWVIASAGNGIANFAPSKILINASAFQNDLGGGSFRLSTNNSSLLLSFAPPPNIIVAGITAGAFTIGGDNGVPNAIYYVLSSTNLTLPLSAWTRVATNTFDSAGNFSFSQPVDPTLPQRFFTIQVP